MDAAEFLQSYDNQRKVIVEGKFVDFSPQRFFEVFFKTSRFYKEHRERRNEDLTEDTGWHLTVREFDPDTSKFRRFQFFSPTPKGINFNALFKKQTRRGFTKVVEMQRACMYENCFQLETMTQIPEAICGQKFHIETQWRVQRSRENPNHSFLTVWCAVVFRKAVPLLAELVQREALKTATESLETWTKSIDDYTER